MKPYTAINASAGSGKTYNLVQRVLMICLANPPQKDAIRNVLALTFTNKAANEMKERILTWLKEFTKPTYENNKELIGIKKELQNLGKNFTLKDLHEQSKIVLDYVLHNYSTLNISTIDKFNSRLVRSFSYELGLAQNFNLEIESEPFLIEAVDKMLDGIGEDEKISDAFLDFVDYNLENEERITINTSLYKKAKKFVEDVHYEQLKSNENFDWQAYEKAKEKLRKEISNHKNSAKEIVDLSLKKIKDSDLTEDDFQGKSNSIAAFFRKFDHFNEGRLENFPFPGNEENAVEGFRKITTSKDQNIIHKISGILDELIENRQKIIQHYIAIQKKEKILKEILPLKINKEIQEQLLKIEEENDLVLLKKFNILIKENLQNEPSAFIYEKIGEKFHHYFLDEFQDTSKMQWENIIPLKENIISSETNSFTLVGDPKQSIYRFRGGDSELMLDIINQKENTHVPVHVINLKENYRSAVNIVNFNNNLYQYISEGLEKKEHQLLFSEQAKQNPKKDFLGRVKVNLISYSKNNEVFYTEVVEKMHQDIQECINNGFSFSDITVLCRKGGEIKKISQGLGPLKVNYNGAETYIKTISEKGLTLDLSLTINAVVSFLKWENQPKNLQHLIRMMYYLSKSEKVKLDDFSVEIQKILRYKSKKEIQQFVFEQYGIRLENNEHLKLNLYNFIEYYVHEFSIEHFETDYLLNFLEMLYNFTQKSGATLKDFLKYWEEEGCEKSIQESENIDAIKFLTIHAAKGLEFPVVFLPMFNSSTDGKINEWFQVDSHDELRSVNIDAFKKELAVYDEDIKNFNEENTYKNKIDRLCVQYVATTRAEEQLFFYLQKGSASSNHMEILSFVKEKNGTDDVFDMYEEKDGSYRKQNFNQEKPVQKMGIVNVFQKNEKKKNITIATPSKNYQERNEKVRNGIFTHEILSKINAKKDIEKVLTHYLLEGVITEAEKHEITQKIVEITEKFPAYFAENQEVLNERDLLIEGKTYRPDRMVKIDDAWFIVDFKTGTPSEKDKEKYQKQISFYQKAMEDLGKKVGGAELIYL